jgi:hypothetical protein
MTDHSKIGASNVRRSKTQERRLAKLFTSYTGVEFRRRRVEGRDSTTIERESTADVIPVKGDCIFSIEAKCGKFGSIDALLANPYITTLTEWWHQASYDAKLMTDLFLKQYYPLLFFKFNRNSDWVAVGARGWDQVRHVRIVPTLFFKCFSFIGPVTHNVSHTKNKNNKVLVPLELDDIVFLRWKDFISAVDPKSIFRE